MFLGDPLEELGDELPVIHGLDLLPRREGRALGAVGLDRLVLTVREHQLDQMRAITQSIRGDRALAEMRDRFFHAEACKRPGE